MTPVILIGALVVVLLFFSILVKLVRSRSNAPLPRSTRRSRQFTADDAARARNNLQASARAQEEQRRRDAAGWARSPANPLNPQSPLNINNPLNPANPRNPNNPANPNNPLRRR